VNRGHLRIYLGAAPGVGKTFAMLSEGCRRAERGTDVVVGLVETHGRARTSAQLGGLEVVPRRTVSYRGADLAEMDLDAVLARGPKVVLVDELAHTNVPGSAHEKRWQDVDTLLAAGIDVITTVNIQHLESLNDVVESITGIRQRETVPDWFVRQADQVELVDMTPEALRRRMAHGNIYAAEKVDAALSNYFRVGNLSALRELALLWVADKVDDALRAYMADHDIAGTWETRERVVVAVTGAASGEQLIRRAGRMAQRSHADLIGVNVKDGHGVASRPGELLLLHQQLLRDLGGEYHEIVSDDIAEGLAGFARSAKATQLVLGSTRRSRWNELLHGSVINKAIRLSGGIDVHVISFESENPPERRLPQQPRSPLPRRRRLAGWITAAAGLIAVTAAFSSARDAVGLSSVLLTYLLLVCIVAAVGGFRPALATALTSAGAANWFFTKPYGTFIIDDPEQVFALAVLVAAGALVSILVGQTARLAADAQRARAEAEALAAAAGRLSGDADPLRAMLAHLRITFGQDAVALFRSTDSGGWELDATDGETEPEGPTAGDAVPIGATLVLTLVPGILSVDDRRVLNAFATRVAEAVERRELQAAAGRAAVRDQADELRVAILRAVSHDLRSPLASIKASSTSLLQGDIDWTPAQVHEFAETIDEEADRLDHLVGNLLDVSRIEAGVVEANTRPVGLDDAIAAALGSISGSTRRVVVDVARDLPAAIADAGLLERVLANVITNALDHSPDDTTVTVEATGLGDHAVVRVIDRGAGVDDRHVQQIFDPFQRLGDTTREGVGLGLAVARGFTAAMHGSLTVDHTPGGGLTVTLTLPLAPPSPSLARQVEMTP
jgi:two-component system sensor histidine kinase KdpD